MGDGNIGEGGAVVALDTSPSNPASDGAEAAAGTSCCGSRALAGAGGSGSVGAAEVGEGDRVGGGGDDDGNGDDGDDDDEVLLSLLSLDDLRAGPVLPC